MNVNVSIYRWFHELDLFADLLMIVILDLTDTSMIFRIMPYSHSISGPIHFRPKNEVEPPILKLAVKPIGKLHGQGW